MKKTTTKSALLFASIMALAAFAMPSMASAATWGPNTFNHTLSTPGLMSFFVPTLNSGPACKVSLGVRARFPASSTLDINSATFTSCGVSSGMGAGCQVTMVASGLPWTATGTSTSDVRINVTDIAITYSQVPFGPWCGYPGLVGHMSGTLTGGAWSAAAHSVTYASDTGLFVNYGGNMAVWTNGLLTDSGVNPLTLT